MAYAEYLLCIEKNDEFLLPCTHQTAIRTRRLNWPAVFLQEGLAILSYSVFIVVLQIYQLHPQNQANNTKPSF